MRLTTRRTVIVLLTAVVGLAGCYGAGSVKFPETVPLSGKVTLDGEPLSGAAITFSPAFGNKDGHHATGRTDEDGNYELKTSIGNEVKPGAVPGGYRVFISLRTTPDGTPTDPMSKIPQPGKESLKPVYSDAQKSKLGATVSDDGGEQNFDLKSK